MFADLQCSQQVARLSQPSSGSVQLLQQFVLRLLQCGDLSLSASNVLLALLHLLLQPRHLRGGETGDRDSTLVRLYLSVAATLKTTSTTFYALRGGISIKNALNNHFYF